MTPIARTFGALVLAQAAHSTEEYVGRLWDSFPPARFVAGLVSEDLERGFVALNVALVAFGAWCFIWPMRRQWPSAGWLARGWATVEAINGTVHLLWSLRQGSYTPGTGTAPLLVILALHLARQLRDARAIVS
jgi:Protein of unknown function with HXXEE motif